MNFSSKVTIKQIAAEAGVSVMTVSRSINCPEKVKDKTKKRVLEASQRLGYRPNTIAKALSEGKTNIIYCYIPKDQAGSNPFYLYVVAGISEELGKHGYSLLLRTDWYNGQSCDGVILIGLRKYQVENALSLSKDKHVVVFGHLDGADCIDVDNRLGMKLMGEYIVSQGKKKILYLSVDSTRDYVFDREAGFLEAIKGKASCEIWRCENDTYSANAYLEKYFSPKYGFDCICAATDDIALAAMHHLRNIGMSVPDDISVTGFDGLGRELLSVPAITTVKQPIVEIGHQLAVRIIERIKNNDRSAAKRFVPPTLVVNGTVR